MYVNETLMRCGIPTNAPETSQDYLMKIVLSKIREKNPDLRGPVFRRGTDKGRTLACNMLFVLNIGALRREQTGHPVSVIMLYQIIIGMQFQL